MEYILLRWRCRADILSSKYESIGFAWRWEYAGFLCGYEKSSRHGYWIFRSLSHSLEWDCVTEFGADSSIKVLHHVSVILHGFPNFRRYPRQLRKVRGKKSSLAKLKKIIQPTSSFAGLSEGQTTSINSEKRPPLSPDPVLSFFLQRKLILFVSLPPLSSNALGFHWMNFLWTAFARGKSSWNFPPGITHTSYTNHLAFPDADSLSLSL